MSNLRLAVSLIIIVMGFPCDLAFGGEDAYPGVRLRTVESVLGPRFRRILRFETTKGVLSFDNEKGVISFRAESNGWTATYRAVRKVVFDESHHARGTGWGLFGGLTGGLVDSAKVIDYWMYVEFTAPDGSASSRVMEIPGEVAPAVVLKAKSAVSERVSITEVRTGDPVETKTLVDIKSKHTFVSEFKNRPEPQAQPGRALVVVVCPWILSATRGGLPGDGTQIKMHANDRVILVNKRGTYGFANLEPGQYRLVSQSNNASGLSVDLEAGGEYYFLQDSLSIDGSTTALSQHSKELVLHELSVAVYSRWTRKPDPKRP